jgi:hypothetical protein
MRRNGNLSSRNGGTLWERVVDGQHD